MQIILQLQIKMLHGLLYTLASNKLGIPKLDFLSFVSNFIINILFFFFNN